MDTARASFRDVGMPLQLVPQAFVPLDQLVLVQQAGKRQDAAASAHQLGKQFSGKNARAERIGPHE